MSKRSGKSRRQEETAPSAVEELDEALDALPNTDTDDDADLNPLTQVDVSGETSFESAEFVE